MRMNGVNFSWENIDWMIDRLLDRLQPITSQFECVVGITRGGVIPANIISHALNIPAHYIAWQLRNDRKLQKGEKTQDIEGFFRVLFDYSQAILIVDDMVDFGNTFASIDEYILCSVHNNSYPAVIYSALCCRRESVANERCPAFETGYAIDHSEYVYFPWDPQKAK